MVAVVHLEGEAHIAPGSLLWLVSELPGELGVGHQGAEAIEHGLHLPVGALGDLGRDGALDHLPEQVALVVDGHQAPTVDLGLDLGDPGLDGLLLVELVADLPGVLGMRCQLGVRGLAV